MTAYTAQQIVKFLILEEAIQLYDEFHEASIRLPNEANATDTPLSEDAEPDEILALINSSNVDSIYDTIYAEIEGGEDEDAIERAETAREIIRTCGDLHDYIPTINTSPESDVTTRAIELNGQWVCWDVDLDDEESEWMHTARLAKMDEATGKLVLIEGEDNAA
ncbi:hypothetical protein [Acinetobacter baumannii]